MPKSQVITRDNVEIPNKKARLVEFSILLLTLFITNRRSWLCIYEINKPLFSCEYGSWVHEILVLVFISAIIIVWLAQLDELRTFLSYWARNPLLLIFLTIGILSFFWSVSLLGTTQRVLQLTLSTFIAAYLGYRYSIKSFLGILFWFFLVVTVVSFILAAVLPGAAIMTTYPHEGFWRGAFSHRNYLGSLAALGNVVSVITFFVSKIDVVRKILSIFVFCGTVALILLSGSATGLIIVLFLNLVLLLGAGWIYLWPKISRLVKWGIAVSGVALISIFILNLEKVLNLIGRSTTLTGRIPLWEYLIKNVASHNLFLGYGLGTIWTFSAFREQSAKDLGWVFQVINGHSGYVDTLLYLGIIGLFFLLLIAIQALIRTISTFAKKKEVISFFPFLVVIYVLVANITISFFFEFETFHWVLLVAMLFMTTSTKPIKTGDPKGTSNDVSV